MSFLYSPPDVSTCYRPQVFRDYRASTADVERVLVNVYAAGSLEATFRKEITSSASSSAFNFDIDVSPIVARVAAPNARDLTTIFGSLDTMGAVNNTDVLVPYYITTDLEIRNTSGLLETVGSSTETSSTLYGLPAIRPLSDVTLNDYYQPCATGDFLFLTDAPAAQDIGRDESGFISYLSKGINALEVAFYSAAGLQTSAVINTGNQSSAIGMQTVAIGPAQLEGSGSFTMHNGTLPTSLTAYTYYTLSAGLYSGSYSRESEVQTFTLVPSCGWGKRFYWMGRTGGIEQYTFKGQIIEKQKDSGDTGQIAPAWDVTTSPPVNSHSRGLIRTDIQQESSLEITEAVSPTTAYWLRSIRTSPEVYMEQDGNYIPVIIESGEATVSQSRAGLIEFKLTVIFDRESSQGI